MSLNIKLWRLNILSSALHNNDAKSDSILQTGSFGHFGSMNRLRKAVHSFLKKKKNIYIYIYIYIHKEQKHSSSSKANRKIKQTVPLTVQNVHALESSMFIVFVLFHILMLRKTIISTCSGESLFLSLITIRTCADTDVPETQR